MAKEREPVIQVKNLYKIYRVGENKVRALNGVNLKIYRGEFCSIVGTSGSGKSTMLNMLAGLEKPTKGEIIVGGEHLEKMNENQLVRFRREHVGFIFQSFNLLGTMNAKENVALPLTFRRVPKKVRLEKADQMLELVGLSKEHANRYPHQFSGGQRQRIGIARALVMDPQLIIADEAISALDVSIQAQVVNLMKKIQKEYNTAFLFIAHDLSMVKYISDRIGVMHMGHLVETGTTEEIFRNPIHPYTRSLLSAIPEPNPVVEKERISLSYDQKEAGVDYTKGTRHLVDGDHYVLATDEEFEKWTREAAGQPALA